MDDNLVCLEITRHFKVSIKPIMAVTWTDSRDYWCSERSHVWRWRKCQKVRTSQTQYFPCKFCSSRLCHNSHSTTNSGWLRSGRSSRASWLVERRNGCTSTPVTGAFWWTSHETTFPCLRESLSFTSACGSSTGSKWSQPKPQVWARSSRSSKSTSQCRSPETHAESVDFSWFRLCRRWLTDCCTQSHSTSANWDSSWCWCFCVTPRLVWRKSTEWFVWFKDRSFCSCKIPHKTVSEPESKDKETRCLRPCKWKARTGLQWWEAHWSLSVAQSMWRKMAQKRWCQGRTAL